jgi:hypothetical protein
MNLRDYLYTLAVLICGTVISSAGLLINPYRFGGPPVTPVSPGTTDLVSWFDFAVNGNDQHSTKHFTFEGAPAFTAGTPSYVTFSAASRGYNISGLGAAFNAAAGDCAFVIRWRGYTALANNATALVGSRFSVTYSTVPGDMTGRLSGATKAADIPGALNTWYTSVYSWDEATDTVSQSLNGSTFTTAVDNTPEYGSGTVYLPGYVNIEVDFAGFYNKQLTQANVAWLYNADSTRTYTDL